MAKNSKNNGKKDWENLLAFTEEESVQEYRSFMPSPFIAAALPLRDVKKNVFVRKYNNITLRLTGGIKVPFGKYGRLLLTILTTHAVLADKQNEDGCEINYKSIKQLLDELQLPSSRGNDVKEQLECFAQSSFIFEEHRMVVTQKSLFKELLDDGENLSGEVKATKHSTGNIPFMKSLQYLELEEKNGDKKNLAFNVHLSKDFVKFSQDHSVPINYTAYKNITSAVGKDLYAWFVYRNNGLTEPLFISKEALVNQFMPVSETSTNVKDQIRVNFDYIKGQIDIIKEKYYPELKVSYDSDNLGITLFKSKPQIESNDTHYILVTTDI